jgi:hypothetical protein
LESIQQQDSHDKRVHDSIVRIQRNRIQFRYFSFSENFSRIFYCNSILFQNNGTSTILINYVFKLSPGAALEMDGNQNEIDISVYSIQFIPAVGVVNSLQVVIKEDAGVAEFEQMQNYSPYTQPKDRRTFLREYAKKKKPNSDF